MLWGYCSWFDRSPEDPYDDIVDCEVWTVEVFVEFEGVVFQVDGFIKTLLAVCKPS